jgi:netrin-G3 ligand
MTFFAVDGKVFRTHVLTVPSQPSNLRTSEVGETSVTLQWSRPTHAGDNIVGYELYWNDTYAKVQFSAEVFSYLLYLLLP